MTDRKQDMMGRVADLSEEAIQKLADAPGADRVLKERAMRRRQLKALGRRLGQLQQMKLTARELLLKLGEAKGRYRAAWRLMDIQFPKPTTKGIASFSFALNRQKLRIIRRREGRYLLRINLLGRDQLNCGNFTSS